MKNFYLLFFVSLLLFSCNQRGTKNSDDNNLSPKQKIRSIKDEVSYTDIEGNIVQLIISMIKGILQKGEIGEKKENL